MEQKRVLITGSKGFIGGSVLSKLTSSSEKILAESHITALVRGSERAKVLQSKGISTVLFDSIDSSDQLRTIASDFDGITKLDLTTGTSNLSDQPITGAYKEDRVFSDTENIYAYEKMRNGQLSYGQRVTDLTVVETGLKQDVKTHLIMSGLIYGRGTGHFNTLTIQVPLLVRAMIASGQAEVVGDGRGIWNHVHIEDVADLYEIITARVLAGEDLPSGESGFYFSENGTYTWLELAQGIGHALAKAGKAKTAEVKSIGLEEAAQTWVGGNKVLAELGFASNSRTKAERGRGLGWKPKRVDEDFKRHFEDEVQEILKKAS
ncbi:hypothetical protein ACLMJK_006146 [Lecanora helva]